MTVQTLLASSNLLQGLQLYSLHNFCRTSHNSEISSNSSQKYTSIQAYRLLRSRIKAHGEEEQNKTLQTC
jgi:hypothetical protein